MVQVQNKRAESTVSVWPLLKTGGWAANDVTSAWTCPSPENATAGVSEKCASSNCGGYL